MSMLSLFLAIILNSTGNWLDSILSATDSSLEGNSVIQFFWGYKIVYDAASQTSYIGIATMKVAFTWTVQNTKSECRTHVQQSFSVSIFFIVLWISCQQVHILWEWAPGVWNELLTLSPEGRPGMSDVFPPVWNLRAIIWFQFAISCLVLLPSPVTLSVLSFSACWPFLLNFFQKILQYFSLRDGLFCMAPV